MNIAILLSGGAGLRMGLDMPKQYIRISGRMLITYSLEALLTHPMVDAVQIAAADEWREAILADVRGNGLDTGKICGFSAPGVERQSSVFNTLKDLKCLEIIHGTVPDCDCAHIRSNVLIHDAVRPNLSREQITSCLSALRDHDGAMPVLPMKDTVYLSDDGRCVSELLEREKVFAGQAPEAFDFDKYYAANLRLLPDRLCDIKGSTEPAVMAGMDIAMIPGDESNYKITTKTDLERFKRQKEKEAERSGEASEGIRVGECK